MKKGRKSSGFLENFEWDIFSVLFLIILVVFILTLFSGSNKSYQSPNQNNFIPQEVNQIEFVDESCDDNCVLDKALDDLSEEKCFLIGEEEGVAVCGYMVNRNAIFEASVMEDDVEVCSQLDSKSDEQRCRDNYYFVSAINKKDSNYCSQIKDEALRNECY